MHNQNEKIIFNEELCCFMDADSEEQYWPVADVCETLEITDVDLAISELDPAQKIVTTVETDTNDSGVQDTTFIDYSGLFILSLKSDAPISKKLRRWVAHEVLPHTFAPNPFSYDMDMSIREELINCELLPWWCY